MHLRYKRLAAAFAFSSVAPMIGLAGCSGAQTGSLVAPFVSQSLGGARNLADSERSGSSPVELSAPGNWLAQKVCVDGNDVPVAVDPFNANDDYGRGCSGGYKERNIRSTDPATYYRYTGSGNLSTSIFSYSIPVVSPSGEQMFVMDRQFTPQNGPPPNWYVNGRYYPGHSHYDLYRLQNGWVSNASTRDTSGLNQIFFGDKSGIATPYNGWVDFPFTYLESFGPSASTNVPVRDVHWEQTGLPWPLPTQNAPASTSTQTTWALHKAFRFDSGKTMNTIVSSHQSAPLPNAANADNGHMEIWYFTIPYGPSRWEVWSAASCLASTCKSTSIQYCSPTEPKIFPYGRVSYTYYRTDCKDYTKTTLATPGSTLPQLPIAETNRLSDFHFSTDPINTSRTATGWTVKSMTLHQLVSSTSIDTDGGKYAPGVRYLKASCDTACSLYQDVPMSTVPSGTYAFGVAGLNESSTGNLQVTLSQVDSGGTVLANSTTTAFNTVNSTGDDSRCPGTSVVTCSTYVGGTAIVSPISGAVSLRESISIGSGAGNFDITQAYLGQL